MFLLLTQNPPPPVPTELQTEPPASTESNTFSTPRDQETEATNMATAGHSHRSPFSPSTAPGLEQKQIKKEFPETLLFSFPISGQTENTSYQKLCLGRGIPPTHHFPKSACGILNLVPSLNCKKSKWCSLVKCHSIAWTPALYKQKRNRPCSNLTREQNSPTVFI